MGSSRSHDAQKIFFLPFYKDIKSFFIFFTIFVGHVFFIDMALNHNPRSAENSFHELLLQVSILHPQKVISEFDSRLPEANIRFESVQPDFQIPAIKNIEIDKANLDLSIDPNTHYELPSPHSDRYANVFDPRLRKQLQENHQVVSKAKIAKLRTWNDGSGNTVAEVGEGDCIRSMPGGDGVGITWSTLHFKCGKDESDRMMDNINADLDARKHPLSQ